MTPTAKFFPACSLALILVAVAPWPTLADDPPIAVTSAPVGYVATTCQGGSDTLVSVPFHRPAAWAGRLDAAPSAGDDGVLLTLVGDPEFDEGQLLAAPHYVLFGSGGALAGEWFEVISHNGSEVEVEAPLTALQDASAGDPVMIIPHWTLASLLPPATQPTAHLSEGSLLTQRGTEVLFFDRDSEGIQLAPNRKFFVTTAGWFEAADGTPEAGDVLVPPGLMLVIRHPEGAPSTVFVARQQVFTGPLVQPIRRSESQALDNALAAPRPIPVRLADLDLDDEVFTPSSSNEGVRMDELLVYDNAEAAINKQPSATYFRTPVGWVEDADGFPAADDTTVDGAQGLVIRKAAGPGDSTLRWLNAPRY